MSESTVQDLGAVAETLLIPLSIRALESQRPDAIIRDERAAATVQQLGYDPTQILARVDEESWIGALLRSQEFDRQAQEFLAAWPDAVVVHIGSGLDTRFERVDNGTAEWYDLDLPEVVELRRRLIGDEGARHHLLACSVLDEWYIFTSSEPRLLHAERLARAPWVRRIPLFANSWGVYHYQLGNLT